MKTQNDITFGELTAEQVEELLPPNLALLAWRGSIAQGTYIPSEDPDSIDDKDLMGVFVAPLSYYLGIESCKPTIETFITPYDLVSYEMKKFIGLLLKGNPNVLSILWNREQHLVLNTWAGQKLIQNRYAFLSKQIYHSFTGYAYSQLKRMTHFDEGSGQGYMGKKRKELAKQLGHDAKHAQHLIRLLRMGIEALTEKDLHVMREDAPELISIKKGEWSLEKVQSHADVLFEQARQAYIISSLPIQPDYETANRICMEIIAASYNIEIQENIGRHRSFV